MKFRLALFFALIASPLAQAAETYSFCQVKLLKVATDALVQEYADKGQKVGFIKEVVYNYNLEGLARVIFLSRHVNDPDEVCFIDVRTIEPQPEPGKCPEYKFSEIRTTCK